MPRGPLEYYGRHFDARRTKDTHGDMGVLYGNFVNLSMPAGSTHFDHLMEIGRSSDRPFPIKFLSEKLKELEFVRGCVYFGRLGNQIQKILLNYPYLRWWIEEDGLVVDEARSELGPLSDFDRIAGLLVIEHMKDDTCAANIWSRPTPRELRCSCLPNRLAMRSGAVANWNPGAQTARRCWLGSGAWEARREKKSTSSGRPPAKRLMPICEVIAA